MNDRQTAEILAEVRKRVGDIKFAAQHGSFTLIDNKSVALIAYLRQIFDEHLLVPKDKPSTEHPSVAYVHSGEPPVKMF